MSFPSEIFGQLKHIDNRCLAFLVAHNSDIQCNVHSSETQTIAETSRNFQLTGVTPAYKKVLWLWRVQRKCGAW